MQHQRSRWTALFIALAVSAFSAPVHALNEVSWVSSTGSGAACTRAAPCATFVAALSNTLINGEIRCLDAGNFAAVIIQQSVTIDCHEARALVLAAFSCFIINLTTTVASDPAQTVKIRGVTCDGFAVPGPNGSYGVSIVSAAAVYLDDMVITDMGQQGVIDTRPQRGVVFIRNSAIRNTS